MILYYIGLNMTGVLAYTVHSESIQTPWLFPHFVTLQPYSKMDQMFFPLIYTQYPIW
jgi:hypothetical protein